MLRSRLALSVIKASPFVLQNPAWLGGIRAALFCGCSSQDAAGGPSLPTGVPPLLTPTRPRWSQGAQGRERERGRESALSGAQQRKGQVCKTGTSPRGCFPKPGLACRGGSISSGPGAKPPGTAGAAGAIAARQETSGTSPLRPRAHHPHHPTPLPLSLLLLSFPTLRVQNEARQPRPQGVPGCRQTHGVTTACGGL